MPPLPDFDSLPRRENCTPSAWGLFGEHDNVGTVNRLTAQRVAAAAGLIRDGRVFSLNAPMNAFSNTQFGRGEAVRHTIHHPRFFDDYIDGFALQGASHWDSLGHVGYDPAHFYNGATEAEVESGARNTIEHWAERGIAGRGVLLDLARTMTADGRPFDPGSATAFTVEDLELARDAAGAEIGEGDVLVLRTGFAPWFASLPRSERDSREFRAPGIDHSEQMCRYLWNLGIAAIATDTFAVEVWPPDWRDESFPWGQLHVVLIGQLGMALGEMWWLESLADDCARDRRYDFFLTSSPLNVPGAYGSPANALAIK